MQEPFHRRLAFDIGDLGLGVLTNSLELGRPPVRAESEIKPQLQRPVACSSCARCLRQCCRICSTLACRMIKCALCRLRLPGEHTLL